MKNVLIRLLITTILIVVLSHFLPGIHVATIKAALIVAVVLGLLNTFLKPVLVFFTLPITLLTLGLFLLVINTGMVLLADHLIDEFKVDGFVNAFVFSVVLSLSQWFLNLFVQD
ncbi:phage holin family protein [Flavobacterium suncheonense]|uniref:Membrane protein n=1 Tax=Flavobacterium suncheonense GH29-5 = DSM 17707 TaxID=1121899 RepID=A0A0A2MB20_9FLAO|nr:phage holin family protein [Flavobacterium suncheonense]KGO88836.1 membrane protein [Flavobacterium suncheonense GH29-5 = DSM 17707]